jgi:hypothetical protein
MARFTTCFRHRLKRPDYWGALTGIARAMLPRLNRVDLTNVNHGHAAVSENRNDDHR